MARWKSICCAIDFSDASRFTMEEAAELARATGAELTLLHVHEARPRASGTEAQPLLLVAVDAQRDLSIWRSEAERRCGAPVRGALLSGRPAEEIVRFAREHDVDALVVGTRGRGGFAQLLLGSVAEELVRRAPCLVVAARAREPAEHPAAEPPRRRAV